MLVSSAAPTSSSCRRSSGRTVQTEVVVRVMAAGINPVDWKTRRYGGNPKAVGEPPFILGWDIAGVVEEPADRVPRFAVGDRVFGMPWFPRLARGYAEYVTSPARQLRGPRTGSPTSRRPGCRWPGSPPGSRWWTWPTCGRATASWSTPPPAGSATWPSRSPRRAAPT